MVLVRPSLAALVLSLSLAAPALAVDALECTFEMKASNLSWVPEVVAVAPGERSGEAVVMDPVINHFLGEPVIAKVDADNSKRSTYRWEVKAKSGTNQYVRMQYRMTVMKADLSASISATPQGYADNFQSAGRCKPVKG